MVVVRDSGRCDEGCDGGGEGGVSGVEGWW